MPADPDSLDNVRRLLKRWAAEASRAAWRPITGERPEGSVSQFCGTALLQSGEVAPTCKLCGRDLQLFVQLDLDTLPSNDYGHGVLQLLYCAGWRPN